jgi:hypothetical protein
MVKVQDEQEHPLISRHIIFQVLKMLIHLEY